MFRDYQTTHDGNVFSGREPSVGPHKAQAGLERKDPYSGACRNVEYELIILSSTAEAHVSRTVEVSKET